jgi:hypothetical protein
MKKTMLKKEDWGGLALASILATFVFPPYFIHLMAMAALSEFGHLYINIKERVEADKGKFQQFEREFRKGYQMEKNGDLEGALDWYRRLEREYAGLPQGAKLCTLKIQKMEKAGVPPAVPVSRKALRSPAKKTRRRLPRKRGKGK